MVLYLGKTTLASTPAFLNALGKEPATSPSPPLLAYGATSEATNNTLRPIQKTSCLNKPKIEK